jgi:branched-chain amino acid transport system permease protein
MKAIKRASPFVFAVLLAVVPLVVRNAYVLHLMILVGVYVLLTQGLNVIFGYLGLLSLGQQAFLAIGGYVTAMLALKVGFSFWLILPIAILATIVLGLAIGYITLRFRSAYFVIVTIAVADIVRTNSQAKRHTTTLSGPWHLWPSW